MPTREQELLIRRERLISRSGQLRGALVEQVQTLRPQTLLVDSASTGLQWARTHPGVLLAAVAMVVVLRPRRLWHWGGRLIGAWQFVKRVRPLWAATPARRD